MKALKTFIKSLLIMFIHIRTAVICMLTAMCIISPVMCVALTIISAVRSRLPMFLTTNFGLFFLLASIPLFLLFFALVEIRLFKEKKNKKSSKED